MTFSMFYSHFESEYWPNFDLCFKVLFELLLTTKYSDKLNNTDKLDQTPGIRQQALKKWSA
jgi:hypothetical protein